MVLQKFEETARDALNKTLFLYSVKLYVGIICNYLSKGRGIWVMDFTRRKGNKGFHFPLLYIELLS